MPPVRCRVDQHVIRTCLYSSLDDRLQVLVLNFSFLERQIIYEQYELVVAVSQVFR